MQFFILRNPYFAKQFCCFAFEHPNLPGGLQTFCAGGAAGSELIQQLTHLVGGAQDRRPQSARRGAHLEGQIAAEVDCGQLRVGEPRLLAAKDDGDRAKGGLGADLLADLPGVR